MQCALPRSALGEAAGSRGAQHAAGNLDNRHVEIVCAASARVNVSVLYQFIDTANWPWPTGVAPRQEPLSGRAARGSVAPRKMTCRPAAGERIGSRPSTRARRGSLVAAPFKSEQEWTRRATLLCSPPCRSPAQASLGIWITLFWVRSFLHSVESPLSTWPRSIGADMDKD